MTDEDKQDAAPAAKPLPLVEVLVLAIALTFYEGGHQKRIYLAGTRVSEMSDEAQAWLEVNDVVPSKGKKVKPYTKKVKVDDAEGAKRAADIILAEQQVAELGIQAREAAIAFVQAEPENVTEAIAANDAASTALNAATRRLANLRDA